MVWKAWDRDRVASAQSHSAINLFRQAENARDHSANRTHGNCIYYDPRDPFHCGSIGKHRGSYFRQPVGPEIGSLRLVYTYEVFDGPVNFRERLMGGTNSEVSNAADLAVTNGKTTLVHTVDITEWQRRGWSPRGVPIGLEVKSLTGSVQSDWGFALTASAVDFLAANGDPLGNIINPLKCMSVEFRRSGSKQSTGSLPTSQVIETIALAGNSAWSATIAAGGSGYVEGDGITLVGGTSTEKATFWVRDVSGSGAVVSAVATFGGDYSVRPSDPVSTTTGGGGTGCTLNVGWNDGGFRIWPPLASMDITNVGDEPADTIRTLEHGRMKIHSIAIEEIEQTDRYITQNTPDVFGIREVYDVQKALQSGYSLGDTPHRILYDAGEYLFTRRTAVHSSGPRHPGGQPPGSDASNSLIATNPTQVWTTGSAGAREIFHAYFDDGDRFFFSGGVDYERRQATIYADVLFFASEQTEFTASFYVDFVEPTATTSPTGTILYSTTPVDVDVNPITSDDPRGTFTDFEEAIYNHYRTIEEGSSGSRNNLQGLHEFVWTEQWDNFSAGLVMVAAAPAYIPDISIAITPYLRIMCDIDSGQVPGTIKALVLGWHVIEGPGAAYDAMGRP